MRIGKTTKEGNSNTAIQQCTGQQKVTFLKDEEDGEIAEGAANSIVEAGELAR